MKNKYLIFKERPYNIGKIVSQINVSDLSKKGINKLLDELQGKFPQEKYASSITQTNESLNEF